MPGLYCCVQGCHSFSHNRKGEKKNTLRFFRVPAVKTNQGEQVAEVTRRRRMAWIAAIRRKDITFGNIKKWHAVCSLHFHSGKPSYEMLVDHPDWQPSLRLGHGEVKATDEARFQRRMSRRASATPLQTLEQHPLIKQEPPDEQFPVQHLPDQPLLTVKQEQAFDEQVPPPGGQSEQECALCPSRQEVIVSLVEENRRLKSELDACRMNERFLSSSEELVSYYTGLPTFAALQALLLSLLPHLPHGPPRQLSAFQRLLLVLMRLRLALPLQHLAHLFHVDGTTASEVFHRTLAVMYDRLRPAVDWPTRERFRASMPPQFVEAFGGNAAVIIDCFEVSTERPWSPEARSQTFSPYKHDYTWKYLLGITPGGEISFVSKGAGGRASDQFVAEDCGILQKLLPDDIILADRGFDAGESAGLMCATLKIPSSTNDRARLEVKDAEQTGAVAHLRIHVERVAGVCRNKYKILQATVPVTMLLCSDEEPDTTTLDKVVLVCCALTNSCQSVSA